MKDILQNRFKYSTNRRNVEKCPCGLDNKTRNGSYRFAPVEGSENTGKCFSCGKFFYNADEVCPIYEPNTKFNYVPTQMVREMLMDTQRTNHPLIDYFNTYFEKDAIEKVFHSYWIGHDIKDNSIAFPYIDAYNNVRRVQYMKFQFDGYNCKRNKYYHKWDKTENPYQRCFMGEHLISDDNINSEFCVLESQRAMLFMNFDKTDRVWLSTGSKGNLQSYLFNRLKGRKVTLVPDVDGYIDWCKRAEELQKEFPTIDFGVNDDCYKAKDKIGPKGDIEDLILHKSF